MCTHEISPQQFNVLQDAKALIFRFMFRSFFVAFYFAIISDSASEWKTKIKRSKKTAATTKEMKQSGKTKSFVLQRKRKTRKK